LSQSSASRRDSTLAVILNVDGDIMATAMELNSDQKQSELAAAIRAMNSGPDRSRLKRESRAI
jgi:hypothetical protein